MSMIGKHCVIRTYSAGVHIGTVAAHDAKSVTLTDARRIWRWFGALELYAVAQHGVDSKKSTFSVPAPEIVLTEAIEIIPTTEAARATFDACEGRREQS